jgi:hypothetical protein
MKRESVIANSAGPNPPSHAVKITAQSINNAMGSVCSKRARNSVAMTATATDKTASA